MLFLYLACLLLGVPPPLCPFTTSSFLIPPYISILISLVFFILFLLDFISALKEFRLHLVTRTRIPVIFNADATYARCKNGRGQCPKRFCLAIQSTWKIIFSAYFKPPYPFLCQSCGLLALLQHPTPHDVTSGQFPWVGYTNMNKKTEMRSSHLYNHAL